jgi:hypothetical protein
LLSVRETVRATTRHPRKNLTIEEAALAASALAALGGRGHEQAVSTLAAMAERASRQAQRHR